MMMMMVLIIDIADGSIDYFALKNICNDTADYEGDVDDADENILAKLFCSKIQCKLVLMMAMMQ